MNMTICLTPFLLQAMDKNSRGLVSRQQFLTYCARENTVQNSTRHISQNIL